MRCPHEVPALPADETACAFRGRAFLEASEKRQTEHRGRKHQEHLHLPCQGSPAFVSTVNDAIGHEGGAIGDGITERSCIAEK